MSAVRAVDCFARPRKAWPERAERGPWRSLDDSADHFHFHLGALR